MLPTEEPAERIDSSCMIHTNPRNILKSLTEGDDGVFKRCLVQQDDEKNPGCLFVLWNLLLENSQHKTAELLIRLDVVTNESDKCVIKIETVDEDAIPGGEAVVRDIRGTSPGMKKLDTKFNLSSCTVVIEGAEYGQSTVRFQGMCRASASASHERNKFGSNPSRIQNMFTMKRESSVSSSLLARSASSRSVTTTVQRKNSFNSYYDGMIRRNSNLKPKFSGGIGVIVRGILSRLSEQWEDSKRVDRERKQCTIDMINNSKEQLGDKDKAIIEDTAKILSGEGWKYWPGAGIDSVKFSAYHEKKDPFPWGRAESVIHTSADSLLAYLIGLDSIERRREYAKKHSCVALHCTSDKVRHFFHTIKWPYSDRMFESRMVWDKLYGVNGRPIYRLAWVPATDVIQRPEVQQLKKECGFREPKSVLTESYGMFELREVSKGITRLTLVLRTCLKVPIAVLNEHLKGELAQVSVFQEKFARNQKIVDKEITDALVDTMRVLKGKDLLDEQVRTSIYTQCSR